MFTSAYVSCAFIGVYLTMHEYLYIHTHELGFIMSTEYGVVKSWRLKAVSSRPTFV